MQNTWQVDVDQVLSEVEKKIGEARTEPKAVIPTELLLKVRKAFQQLLEPRNLPPDKGATCETGINRNGLPTTRQ